MGKKEQRVVKKVEQKVEESESNEISSSSESYNQNSGTEEKQLNRSLKMKRQISSHKQKAKPLSKKISKPDKPKPKNGHLQIKKDQQQDESFSQEQQIPIKKQNPRFKKQEVMEESDDNSDEEMIQQAQEDEADSSSSSEVQQDAEDQSDNISSMSSQQQSPDFLQRIGKVKKQQGLQLDSMDQARKIEDQARNRLGLGRLDTLVNQVSNIRLILERIESALTMRNGIHTTVTNTSPPVLQQPIARQASENLPVPPQESIVDVIKIEALQSKQQQNIQIKPSIPEADEKTSEMKEKDKKKKKKPRTYEERIKIE